MILAEVFISRTDRLAPYITPQKTNDLLLAP